ncbi:hypothetical protein M231_02790 [Tremella mesenterica]|uniref:Uncharacterized protein n=1 Tax=Tremella mesenterica TaxID=5217 RepID=A0A4V1M4C2_TREME|nr:hypothetical protein M231_02790 [Tremella mesenterica]
MVCLDRARKAVSGQVFRRCQAVAEDEIGGLGVTDGIEGPPPTGELSIRENFLCPSVDEFCTIPDGDAKARKSLENCIQTAPL